MGDNKKILVVDDEAYIRRVIEFKMKKQGYEVITAQNGQKALEIIYEQQPDVVISDINMPVMDGRTLCERTNFLKKENPFLTIVITARILPEDRIWVDTMDDTMLLEKPFSLSEIANHVAKYQEDGFGRYKSKTAADQLDFLPGKQL